MVRITKYGFYPNYVGSTPTCLANKFKHLGRKVMTTFQAISLKKDVDNCQSLEDLNKLKNEFLSYEHSGYWFERFTFWFSCKEYYLFAQ